MADITENGFAEFELLSGQLRREIRKLKQTNDILRKENGQILEELKKLRNGGEVFGELTDNQKLILKKQIETLISRIDRHLES